MSAEPDFELLPPKAPGRATWALLLLCAVACLAAAIWAVIEWRKHDQAVQELALAQATRAASTSRLSAEPTARPYAESAARAAELLQAPVDDWLRALERCQPPQAVTRELHVDAEQQKVSVSVEFVSSPDTGGWLRCLNGDRPSYQWKVRRISNEAIAGAPQVSARWVVMLEYAK